MPGPPTVSAGPVVPSPSITSVTASSPVAVRVAVDVGTVTSRSAAGMVPARIAWSRLRWSSGRLFGGWKRSSLGPGAKAGGPNYTMLFATLRDTEGSTQNYEAWWAKYFALEHDPSGLSCEANRFRYRPARGAVLRLDRADTEALTLSVQAARICNVPLILSFTDEETDEQLAARLPALAATAEVLRTLRTPTDALLTAAYDAGLNWICAPVLRSGRYELPRWLREQSVSETLHRYGLIDAVTERR